MSKREISGRRFQALLSTVAFSSKGEHPKRFWGKLPGIVVLAGMLAITFAGNLYADPIVRFGGFEGDYAHDWLSLTGHESAGCFTGSGGGGCTSVPGISGPETGLGWAWFGRGSGGNWGTGQFVIALPPAQLTFSIWVSSAGAGSGLFNVALDDQVLYARSEGQGTTPGYITVDVDLRNATGGIQGLIFDYAGNGANTFNVNIDNVAIVAVPEPATFALLLFGLAFLVLSRGKQGANVFSLRNAN